MDNHSNVFFRKWMFARVQKDFTTVQNQIQILQGEELGGLTERLDWTDGPGDRILDLIKQFTSNYSQKCKSSATLCCVSLENLNHIHDQEKLGNRRESHNSSHPCSTGGFSQDSPQLSSSKKSRRSWVTRQQYRSTSRVATSFC